MIFGTCSTLQISFSLLVTGTLLVQRLLIYSVVCKFGALWKNIYKHYCGEYQAPKRSYSSSKWVVLGICILYSLFIARINLSPPITKWSNNRFSCRKKRRKSTMPCAERWLHNRHHSLMNHPFPRGVSLTELSTLHGLRFFRFECLKKGQIVSFFDFFLSACSLPRNCLLQNLDLITWRMNYSFNEKKYNKQVLPYPISTDPWRGWQRQHFQY